jgi:multidrug efflux pump subunit AcrA (membrane-fusion protein)
VASCLAQAYHAAWQYGAQYKLLAGKGSTQWFPTFVAAESGLIRSAVGAAGKFFGGSYCNVHFETPTDANLVKIPSTALITGNQGTQVAILDSNDKVVLKSVQLGRDLGDSVEVVAGLSPSDRIINSPPETLATGDTIRVAGAGPKVAGPVTSSSTSRQ